MTGDDDIAVLDVLGDETAREILLTLETPHTAREIAETCNVPLSTAYRKLDELAETGLVSGTVRLHENGAHPRAYTRAIVDVHLRLHEEVEVEIETRSVAPRRSD